MVLEWRGGGDAVFVLEKAHQLCVSARHRGDEYIVRFSVLAIVMLNPPSEPAEGGVAERTLLAASKTPQTLSMSLRIAAGFSSASSSAVKLRFRRMGGVGCKVGYRWLSMR